METEQRMSKDKIMNEAIKQEQRLTALVEAFKADSADYSEIDTPRDEEGKRRLLRSVAFCCISTGVFRFPKQRAAEIAVQTVRQWLAGHEGAMERVIFNVFNDKDRERYEQILHSA